MEIVKKKEKKKEVHSVNEIYTFEAIYIHILYIQQFSDFLLIV